MTTPPTVVAVCGSVRDESYTRTALRYALQGAERTGAETELIDLRAYDLPVFDPDRDEQGDSAELTRIVREADGVVVGSPSYHSSYSSAFRNFHDYCSYDDYEDTVVGLLTVAGGDSYASVLDHLRVTMRGVHAWVVPQQVGIPNVYDQFVDDPDAVDGRAFADPDLRERVEELGERVATSVATAPIQQEPICAND